jgi:hypothetical protein
VSVVSNMTVTPNRLEIVYRYLVDRDGGETEADLHALLAPTSLQRRADPGESAIVAEVLREARNLGLVESDSDSKFRVPDGLPVLSTDGFRAYLVNTLLNPTRAAETGQSAVGRALAWFLTQDPSVGLAPRQNVAAQVEADCGSGVASFELTNSDRFNQFHYWARYLGYAWRVEVPGAPATVVPDPTVAVARLLPALLEAVGEMPLGELLRAWAECCPVLEGGAVRLEVEEMFPTAKRRPLTELSRSTSLALRRLEDRGLIRLERRADAVAYSLGIWPTPVAASHVILRRPSAPHKVPTRREKVRGPER